MLHYFNNAGAGMMNDEILHAIIEYYRYEQMVGAYQAARDNIEKIDTFYSSVVRLINAVSADEIAYVDSASRGWNLAIYGSPIAEGDDIITLSTEFGTNLITIYDFAKRVGANVHVINCNEEGHFELSDMENVLKNAKGLKMIAVSQAAAQGSIVNPLIDIGLLAKKYDAVYVVDGCQSVGQMVVDVQEINCDILVATGRKWLCGPRGTGFMYARKSTAIRATQLDLVSADLLIDSTDKVLDVKVRSDARRFELWERNIAAILGFSKAISIIENEGMNKISRLISAKANSIRNAVSENKKLRLLGKIKSMSGIVGFYLVDPTLENYVQKSFMDKGISISVMSDWDCPLAFPKNGASSIFRVSPHYFTNDESIDLALSTIINL